MIQGNREAGVILYGPGATGNLVQGDFILDNGGDGVLVLSGNNEIGQPVGAGTAVAAMSSRATIPAACSSWARRRRATSSPTT